MLRSKQGESWDDVGQGLRSTAEARAAIMVDNEVKTTTMVVGKTIEKASAFRCGWLMGGRGWRWLGVRWLEFGCGRGRRALKLAKLGCCGGVKVGLLHARPGVAIDDDDVGGVGYGQGLMKFGQLTVLGLWTPTRTTACS